MLRHPSSTRTRLPPALRSPVATAPALAIIHADPVDNPTSFLALSVTGVGFGRRMLGGPHRQCGSPGSSPFLEVTYGGTVLQLPAIDPRVPVWNDTQVVAKLPSSARNARVRICTPRGASPSVAVVYYTYDHFGLPPTIGTNPSPLALTTDAQRRVWVNEEFHLDLKYLDPSNAAFTVLDIPKPPEPGPFATTIQGDARTQISQNGEAIAVGQDGRIWFTQGGGEPYDGAYPDHSRVVSYDPQADADDRFRVYNVPGDRNGVIGVAWDTGRQRVWFTQVARRDADTPPTTLLRARLTSFDPERIPFDGHFDFSTTATCTTAPGRDRPGSCSNAPSQPCVSADDCVLADWICPPGSADDSRCYREYELPVTANTYMPAHVMVHRDGSIWYTAYWSGNHIGRLDPESGAFSLFPLAAPRGEDQCDYLACACFTDAMPPDCSPCCTLWMFGAGSWDITASRVGDVLFSEYVNGAVGRFRIAELGNPACAALDERGKNPCIDERVVAPEGVQVHSLALDRDQNVWFTQGGPISDRTATTSVGYMKADWSDFVLMPPLSLYPFFNTTGAYCTTQVGAFVSFTGAGITIEPDTGDIWFADYCRKRLGRLRRQ